MRKWLWRRLGSFFVCSQRLVTLKQQQQQQQQQVVPVWLRADVRPGRAGDEVEAKTWTTHGR